MRLFVALELDEGVKRSLETCCEQLDESGASVRWCRREQMHLTLKFLGATGDDLTADVCRSVERIAEEASPFTLALQGLGTFPGGRKPPRVVWVGARQDSGELMRLHERLDEEMGDLGYKPESRKFVPHLTLGRLRSKKNTEKLLDLVVENRNRRFPQQHCCNLTVYASELKRDGAVYTVVARGKFGGGEG